MAAAAAATDATGLQAWWRSIRLTSNRSGGASATASPEAARPDPYDLDKELLRWLELQKVVDAGNDAFRRSGMRDPEDVEFKTTQARIKDARAIEAAQDASAKLGKINAENPKTMLKFHQYFSDKQRRDRATHSPSVLMQEALNELEHYETNRKTAEKMWYMDPKNVERSERLDKQALAKSQDAKFIERALNPFSNANIVTSITRARWLLLQSEKITKRRLATINREFPNAAERKNRKFKAPDFMAVVYLRGFNMNTDPAAAVASISREIETNPDFALLANYWGNLLMWCNFQISCNRFSDELAHLPEADVKASPGAPEEVEVWRRAMLLKMDSAAATMHSVYDAMPNGLHFMLGDDDETSIIFTQYGVPFSYPYNYNPEDNYRAIMRSIYLNRYVWQLKWPRDLLVFWHPYDKEAEAALRAKFKAVAEKDREAVDLRTKGREAYARENPDARPLRESRD